MGKKARGGGNTGETRLKGGFAHYDSAAVCCALQRSYYNSVLVFMCHSKCKSDTCMSNRAEWGMSEGARDRRRGVKECITKGK